MKFLLPIIFAVIFIVAGCDNSSSSKNDNDTYQPEKDTDVITDEENDNDEINDTENDETTDLDETTDIDEINDTENDNDIISEDCVDGETKTETCGFNENGSKPYICTDGKWSSAGPCEDPDQCKNDETETGEEPCGLNGNGRESLLCTDGQWGLGECVDPDECVINTEKTEPCGFNGNGTTAYICPGGQWETIEGCVDPDECTNDDTKTGEEPCGLNGNGGEEYLCTDGQWTLTGECVDPDECVNDDTKTEAGLTSKCTDGKWKITRTTVQFGSSEEETGKGITTDSSGNIYITGYTLGGMPNAGSYDMFIAKYDNTGTEIWLKQIGTTNQDYAEDIALDSTGNIYITGRTKGSFEGYTNSDDSYTDIVLIKFDKDGEKVWVKQVGTDKNDYSTSLFINTNDEVYITGDTKGILEGDVLTGMQNFFISKYDTDGNQEWIKQHGISTFGYAYGTACDSDGNVYVAGTTYDKLSDTEYLANAFLAKFDSAGEKRWIKTFGTSKNDIAMSLSISNNAIYITGYTKGSFSGYTNKGETDIFISTIDIDGNIISTKQFGTNLDDMAQSIFVDSADTIYITGYTEGNLEGTNAGEKDIFFTKITSDGTKTTTQLGTTEDDAAFSIKADNSGEVYIVGKTSGGLDDNTNIGGSDIFFSIIQTE